MPAVSVGGKAENVLARNRKRLVATASRKRARLQASRRAERDLFRGGGARERADDVFFAAGTKRRRSKADYAPARRFFRRAHAILSRPAARFFGAACTPRPISRAARRGSRKRLVATASRCERACKRTGEPSGAFCGKGGARERGDGGFFAADASARSKKTSEQSGLCSDAVVWVRGFEPPAS